MIECSTHRKDPKLNDWKLCVSLILGPTKICKVDSWTNLVASILRHHQSVATLPGWRSNTGLMLEFKGSLANPFLYRSYSWSPTGWLVYIDIPMPTKLLRFTKCYYSRPLRFVEDSRPARIFGSFEMSYQFLQVFASGTCAYLIRLTKILAEVIPWYTMGKLKN